MTNRKINFFEFWRSQKERGVLIKKVQQLRLDPSQQKRLLGDSKVRAELQNARMASLLPPLGTEVFRRFTPASLEEIQRHHEAEENERPRSREVRKEDPPKPAVHLEAGKPLPFVYGDPPPQLLNTPLEELDPFYQPQKTFIVLSKGNIIHRFNAEPSCYLLSPFSPVRTIAIKILLHSWFRFFIMLTILANCVWGWTAQYIFTAIYIFEVMVKVVSRGFCLGRFTFLRDPWNWLDIMVIITGSFRFLTRFVELGKFVVIKTVSISLKMIAVYPGVRMTAGALIQSVKKLTGVFILTMFGLSILAMIGLQLFMGNLKHKCVVKPFPSNMTDSSFTFSSFDFDFQTHIDHPVNHYYLPDHHEPLLCGNGSNAGVCPEGYSCLKVGANPNYGFTSFDSFGWSLLSLFRLMTHDYWENLLQMVLQTAGKTYVIIFMFLFLPGCFCLLSLILAMVVVTFVEQDETNVTEAKWKEFIQILEVIKRREEEEESSSKAELSEKQDSGPEKKNLPAEINKRKQEDTVTRESEQDHSLCSRCWYNFVELFLKWNCCGCWRWLKQRLQIFVMNPFFDLSIVICIILNTIFMAMDHYPMTIILHETIVVANLVFTVIFLLEMIFRLLAMDPYGYFKVGWNIFDFIIITGSILNLFFMDVMGLSFLDIFEVLRLMRLARWWPTFNLWMKIIWTSVSSLRNLTFILFTVVFTFSVVAMQLFHEDYKINIGCISADNQFPRWHMHDFFHAFLVVFRILCGEWIETMWDCMEVSGQTSCLFFYFLVLVVGNLLILNFFLALLLSSFTGDYLVPDEKEKNNLQIAIDQIKKAMGRTSTCRDPKSANHKKDEDCVVLTVVTSDQNIRSGRAPIAEAEFEFKTLENEKEEEMKQCDIKQTLPKVQQDKDDEDHGGNTPEACCCDNCYRCCPFLDMDRSQGTGRVWSNFRRACLLITQHKFFEIFIIFIILLSSIALVFEDIYLLQNRDIQMVLDTADQVFAYLFLLEMVIKWMALGLKKYFSSFWCWLDFLILIVSLMAMAAGMLGYTELGAGLSLRTLRTLRPLRALSRFQGPKVVLEALAVTLRSMWNLLLVIVVVWLFFNIIGVNLFAGKFSYCYNETSATTFVPEEVNNLSECLSLYDKNLTDFSWKNPYINFDSVGVGYLALLQVASLKGWLEILYSAVDSRMVELQPYYEANLYMSLYFIFFLFFGCFFSFNLFFRFFLNALDLQRHKFGGKHVFMTEEQQKCSRAMMKLFSHTPVKPIPRPKNHCQARLFDLVTNPFFEVFMVVLVCLNMVILMVETDQQSLDKTVILYWFHLIFIFIFFIEFLLKILALRKHYFNSGWNILDFVVIVDSIVGIFMADILEKYLISPGLLPVFRLARVCRILHLFRFTREIRKLLMAFVMSLPALFNICFLLFLLMFTYSIFGMLNFAYVKKEAMINDIFNFETFGNSITCMFVITTSAGWDGVLVPFLNTPPDCDPDIENPGSTIRGNCVSPAVGIIFCTSYILLCLLLVLHLYIVVFLETFKAYNTEQLSDDDLQMFYKTWKDFDPDTSKVIKYSQLSHLCDRLQEPLRIPKPNSIKLAHMDLPLLPGDTIHYLDILMALTAQVFDDPGERDALKARMEENFQTKSSSKESCEPVSSTLRRKREEVAATVIQRAYRKLKQDAGEVAEVTTGASGV
ncbi:sodium channel protein type 4 subunit alpha B-like isoform X2 [Anabas testudineus]|uniref:sodium channel protein type 4 subunit alpha B-like isoform X2 n=1 Tax=Anabas testudineus TaxID=64144 RepID=UPI000E45E2FD|nr:sodium channel protein type 4 subunit alpha B-like isoform X2 [Anabas testudineus]